jgi:bifunctional lysine-specific demethylase and histidyl-hydroxylase NO66
VGDPDVFAQELWTQRPQHLQAAGSFEDLLSLDDVDRIVSTMGLRLPAFRLVKDGDTLPPARYTKTTRTGSQDATGVIDARAVFAEFDAGATLVFQSMHRYWEPLADYCRSLEIALGHPVQANAYITPPGARGFGAHEDSHDVFVLQSYGAKQWQVHDRHDLPPSRPPLIDALVAAGDTLYIPAGFPHSASTQERASAHITIGILALRWSDLLNETVRILETDPALDEPLPLRFAEEDDSFTEEIHRRLQEFSSTIAGVDPEILARRLRRRVLTNRQSLLRGQIQRLLTLDEVKDESTVGRRTGSICVLDRVDGELSAMLGDRELRLPISAEPAMRLVAAEETFIVGDLPGLDEAGRLVLVRRLIREGLLEVVV